MCYRTCLTLLPRYCRGDEGIYSPQDNTQDNRKDNTAQRNARRDKTTRRDNDKIQNKTRQNKKNKTRQDAYELDGAFSTRAIRIFDDAHEAGAIDLVDGSIVCPTSPSMFCISKCTFFSTYFLEAITGLVSAQAGIVPCACLFFLRCAFLVPLFS